MELVEVRALEKFLERLQLQLVSVTEMTMPNSRWLIEGGKHILEKGHPSNEVKLLVEDPDGNQTEIAAIKIRK